MNPELVASINRLRQPCPAIDEVQLAHAAAAWGGFASLTEVGSQQDRNYIAERSDQRYVLKVSHHGVSASELDAQNQVAEHLAQRLLNDDVSTVVAATDGRLMVPITTDAGTSWARLLRFLPGGNLTERRHLTPGVIRALGGLVGRTSVALADFDHPGIHRQLQWDVRHAPAALDIVGGSVTDFRLAGRLARAMAQAAAIVSDASDRLPTQATHHDLTQDNVIMASAAAGTPGRLGVIDLGDVVHSWRVGELAVTVANLLFRCGDDLSRMVPLLQGFHAEAPLSQLEASVLWPLVVQRTAALISNSFDILRLDPDNGYVVEGLAEERQMFATATSAPMAALTALIERTLGFEPPSRTLTGSQFPLVAGLAQATVIDLSTDSAQLHEGRWLTTNDDTLAAATMLDNTVGCTVYAQPRLTEALLLQPVPPANVALGVDIYCAAGTDVIAPESAQLSMVDDGFVVAMDDFSLRVTGVSSSAAGFVAAGQVIGQSVGRLRVQATVAGFTEPVPFFVPSAMAGAWTTVCPDPSVLIGLPLAPATPPTVDLLSRRRAVLADVQQHYYSNPPRIERGWREHLIDENGRTYVDMVNNVAVVGHGHPVLARVAYDQWLRLNTNSRFHYAAIVEYSERIAELCPAGLNRVFLVNSGSEAVDLALRIARTATGSPHVVCLAEAYHGWTTASDAVSTSTADNPGALGSRPDWVHPTLAPNRYRGPHRGADSGTRYADEVRRVVAALIANGRRPAAFIAEALFGNGGGVTLPDGFLNQAYEAIRSAGGLCIADEVQVGLGRLGHYFWGFEQQGVVPDIITVAKGAGSGQPLGVVITTDQIAARFETEGSFFSSSGGSPVSCAIGTAVLDIMAAEDLQSNARRVGDLLSGLLTELMGRHRLIGAIHGMGLYQGVELVRDRVTMEPASVEAYAICNRMLELGVIIQPTSDNMNVLKVKPPMCLAEDSAMFFVTQLDRALTDLC